MKIAVLRTYSLSCEPIFLPLRRLGHEVFDIVFHNPGGSPIYHHELPGQIDGFGADFVVMLGQNDDNRGNVPPVHILHEIMCKRHSVHICCDGSEEIWWAQLESYKENVPFSLHVNIDGVSNGFFKNNGMTTLCPIDDEPFQPRPWLSRSIRLGFCGGWGDPGTHPRSDQVHELLRCGVLHAIKRPYADYDQYRKFMCDMRIAWNQALTGTGDRMHVKARVVEAALGGALLLENVKAPTSNYFEPGEDYLLYENLDDVPRIAGWVDANPTEAATMAIRMRAKVRMYHSARPFWNKVFAHIGMQEAMVQA